jgi:STE24 endopeptidase
LGKLYEIDGSKRSAHSNAYMMGFCGAKRIVLYDTLVKQCSLDEIIAVLSHELGFCGFVCFCLSVCFCVLVSVPSSVFPCRLSLTSVLFRPLFFFLSFLPFPPSGHWKESHTIKQMVLGSVRMFVTFFMMNYFVHTSAIYRSFGFEEQPILIGSVVVVVVVFALFLLSFCFSPSQPPPFSSLSFLSTSFPSSSSSRCTA